MFKVPAIILDISLCHFFEEMHVFSLVPRLFQPPVFDRLQYANMEGEGLGDLVTCGDVR